ncbi:hypothetical protein CHU98_g11088 [Xylaria longipes]|nr:hypothetical protein CHU98_g11088 [Xylaria longipes]
MSAIACPSPDLHSMMNQAATINQSLEKDVHGSDLPLVGAPPKSDVMPALDFPWTLLTKDVQFSPTRCFDDAAEEECIASPDIRPYASTNDEFNSGFEPKNNPMKSPLFASERTVNRSIDELDSSNPSVSIPGDQDLGTEGLPDWNEARGTTPSETSPTSTRSVGRTTSTSPTTSVDQGGAPDTNQHRERNRVAARKCRQKAKRSVAGLQQRERELSQQHRALNNYVSSLREEILDLKTEILRHSDCNSGIIQSYIVDAARRQMD